MDEFAVAGAITVAVEYLKTEWDLDSRFAPPLAFLLGPAFAAAALWLQGEALDPRSIADMGLTAALYATGFYSSIKAAASARATLRR